MELSSHEHSGNSAQGMVPPMVLMPEGDQGGGNVDPVPAAAGEPKASVQSELALAGQSFPPPARPASVVKKAIQDVLIAEGLFAVKLAVDCQTLEQLQEALLKNLGQNSMETRRRYAQSVTRWFFPDGIDGLLRRVWVAHQDNAVEAIAALVETAVEMRKRVTDQLAKILPAEFSAVEYGYKVKER